MTASYPTEYERKEIAPVALVFLAFGILFLTVAITQSIAAYHHEQRKKVWRALAIRALSTADAELMSDIDRELVRDHEMED